MDSQGRSHEFINYNNGDVILNSPTFGDTIKISEPKIKFGTSLNALKDLKHVEEQIQGMTVLPDFGYAEDNYLLE